MNKTPHECWTESGGDGEKYRQLMIEAGNIIVHPEETKPKPHKFVGRTVKCFCEECGGKYEASWHHGPPEE